MSREALSEQDEASGFDTESTTAISRRLREVREVLGATQAELAAEIGVSTRRIQSYEAGETPPKLSLLVALAERGISADWILTGKGPLGPGRPDQVSEGYVLIARMDVRATAGDGALVAEENELEPVPYRRSEITSLGTSPDYAKVIEVDGDSMTPTLLPGEEIVVDSSPGQPLIDGIWAVEVDGYLMIKRLERHPGGRLLVKADNPEYQGFEVDLNEEQPNFRILGRVRLGRRRF